MLNDVILIPITDVDYYYMIENQIRRDMPLFEVGKLLPLLESLLDKSGIAKSELEQYPIEGYYYKTEALQLYFNILRNLQMNQSLFERVVRSGPEYDFLRFVTENPLWGRSRKYPIPGFENAPFKRKYDPLTLTLEDKEIFNVMTEPRPWSIDAIMMGCRKHICGEPNLVELAWLTQNPSCLCAGAETNCAYRMYACITGCMTLTPEYVWKVSPNVEYFGRLVINEYNRLIHADMVAPTIFNHTQFNKKPEVPRVAHLGTVMATNENYYWILDKDNHLSDCYTTEVLTTQMFNERNNQS